MWPLWGGATGRRPVEAITVAVRAGIPLKMALRVTVPERPYFDEKIRPLLETHSGLIEYVGEIGGGSAQICMAKPERWFLFDLGGTVRSLHNRALAHGTPVCRVPPRLSLRSSSKE